MRKLIVFPVLIISIFLFASICPAKEIKEKKLVAIEILSGFGWGKLHARDNYNLIPLNFAFDFDLKPLTRRINFNPKALLQFQIEPFLGLISSPKSNIETGTTFWFKMGFFPETWRFQPYVKLGLGLVYMTLHTKEQSTQFNFAEQMGIGMHYYLTKNTALTLEGRWRHLSNSGIRHPNHGINTYSVLSGITYKF